MGHLVHLLRRAPRRGPGSQWARRIFVVLAALVGFAAAGAQPAAAVNTLVSSSPADGESVATSPDELVLTLQDDLGPLNTVLVTCNSQPMQVGQPTVSTDRKVLTTPVPTPLPRGDCRVTAQLSNPDGTPNGTVNLGFTITSDTATTAPGATTPPATTPPTASGEATDAAPSTDLEAAISLARIAATLGLAVLLGSLVLIVMAWPEGIEYIITVRFLRSAWVLGLLGSVLMAVLMTAQLPGNTVGSSISPSAWFDLTDTGAGVAALARVLLAAACFWVIQRPERAIDQATQLPALAGPALAVATFGFTRSGGDMAALGMAMGVAHAVAMAVWVGGLCLLARVVLAGPGDDDLVHAVRGFGRIATPALIVTVVSGLVQTIRLDGSSLFSTGHGGVVLLKIVVVGLMIFVGIATRQFVNQRLAKVDALSADHAAGLRRATGFEALGGVIAILLSAWLVTLAPVTTTAAVRDETTYGFTSGRIVASEGDFDVDVKLTGVVGRNGVRIEVFAPVSGLVDLVVTFEPPEGSNVAGISMPVPQLTGVGAAVLPAEIGIPLAAPGVWTLTVSGTTPGGLRQGQKTFNLSQTTPTTIR